MDIETTGEQVSTGPLTSTEAYKLRGHEQVIEQGLATFNEVGGALLAIRDERLYRATHGTFEDYCQERWGISRSRAYQLIEASRLSDRDSAAVKARALEVEMNWNTEEQQP